ncbi:MAG: LppX_LprAFG lipoprotein [Janthinobacterium lividum]
MSTTNQPTETTPTTTTLTRTGVRATRRRHLGALTVSGVAVLALGLGACGGNDDTAAPAAISSSSVASPATELSAFKVVQASATQSQKAGSAKFSVSVNGTADGQPLTASSDGSFDAETKAVEMTVTLPAAAGGSTVTLRIVDNTMFISGAPLTAAGQWVQMPLDDAAAMGLDTEQMDPTKTLLQLQAVADDVTEVPAIDVRGVTAKGYSGTIDMAKAMALLPADQQAKVGSAATEISDVPFTLYLDDQNRPVRIIEKVAIEGSSLDIAMDYYDWGSDVNIAAPDPATVTTMPGMDASAGAGADATS